MPEELPPTEPPVRAEAPSTEELRRIYAVNVAITNELRATLRGVLLFLALFIGGAGLIGAGLPLLLLLPGAGQWVGAVLLSGGGVLLGASLITLLHTRRQLPQPKGHTAAPAPQSASK
jgi:hypothetical protein